ncbi:hypothetical protein LR013_04935, partial [candidate division NPL-UPA2 bacterium]|nr:hypothetical protein [candidate division NPL-UPA2 bacterium]
ILAKCHHEEQGETAVANSYSGSKLENKGPNREPLNYEPDNLSVSSYCTSIYSPKFFLFSNIEVIFELKKRRCGE